MPRPVTLPISHLAAKGYWAPFRQLQRNSLPSKPSLQLEDMQAQQRVLASRFLHVSHCLDLKDV